MATYQPSSSEKKTVVLIYLLVGSIMILHKDRISDRVWGHLQQALGRWIFFVAVSFLSLILVFIPFLSLVPVFVLVFIVGLWWYFVGGARSGSPSIQDGGLWIFANLGKRMTDVVDVHPEIAVEEDRETENT